MNPMESESFPVTTAQLVRNMGTDAIPTQIIVSVYTNMIYLMITQTGKVGTLTMAKKDHLLSESSVLLGDRSNLLYSVYANHISSLLASQKTLLLACSLLKPAIDPDNQDAIDSWNKAVFDDVLSGLKELGFLQPEHDNE
ncbi:hypothetical protein BC833DRAFT_624066 [Globomyces pollinis-pini]|nr:hypothetical protein BC833DRAFT_624066 [Globomyces pollinis-pini]